MTEFWPTDYTIGTGPFVEVAIEPSVGGRWYERAADDSECLWGEVAEWDPPGRLVLERNVGATRVDLRHHGLESYGDQAEEMLGVYGSPDGWQGTLVTFAWLAGGRD